MSKLCAIFILTLLSFSLCARLKKGNAVVCNMLLQPCHLFNHCCGDFVCKDYRCAIKGTPDNVIPWAPKGVKCDWSHWCGQGLKCVDNRCEAEKIS